MEEKPSLIKARIAHAHTKVFSLGHKLHVVIY